MSERFLFLNNTPDENRAIGARAIAMYVSSRAWDRRYLVLSEELCTLFEQWCASQGVALEWQEVGNPIDLGEHERCWQALQRLAVQTAMPLEAGKSVVPMLEQAATKLEEWSP